MAWGGRGGGDTPLRKGEKNNLRSSRVSAKWTLGQHLFDVSTRDVRIHLVFQGRGNEDRKFES